MKDKSLEVKCENCGKYFEWGYIRYITIGRKVFRVCPKCKDVSNKFKQDHDIH